MRVPNVMLLSETKFLRFWGLLADTRPNPFWYEAYELWNSLKCTKQNVRVAVQSHSTQHGGNYFHTVIHNFTICVSNISSLLQHRQNKSQKVIGHLYVLLASCKIRLDQNKLLKTRKINIQKKLMKSNRIKVLTSWNKGWMNKYDIFLLFQHPFNETYLPTVMWKFPATLLTYRCPCILHAFGDWLGSTSLKRETDENSRSIMSC